MDGKILSPIGLEQGIIEESADMIWIKLAIVYACQLTEQGGFCRKLHLPVQGRSPPRLIIV
jgi:hypothetical protein